MDRGLAERVLPDGRLVLKSRGGTTVPAVVMAVAGLIPVLAGVNAIVFANNGGAVLVGIVLLPLGGLGGLRAYRSANRCIIVGRDGLTVRNLKTVEIPWSAVSSIATRLVRTSDGGGWFWQLYVVRNDSPTLIRLSALGEACYVGQRRSDEAKTRAEQTAARLASLGPPGITVYTSQPGAARRRWGTRRPGR